MDKQTLMQLIRDGHAAGRKVAVSFCSHVPQEILDAAGLCAIRVHHTEGVEDISGKALPANLCPIVKECYSLCEGEALEEADLIIAETSCDGKKKMYELISRQDRLYYYQVPQGENREYVNPLLRSECEWLIQMLQERFQAEITDETLRQAAVERNRERESVMSLMAVQKQNPPAAWGREILEVLEESRRLLSVSQRTAFTEEARQRLVDRESPVPASARRVLITGCPASAVYQKLLSAVEGNGGVAVCFENCEVVKSNRRSVSTDGADMIQALADGYQDTACAIMENNHLRFAVLEQLVQEYQVDGIIDLALQTCHAYTVERYKIRRFCTERNIPYLSVETSFGDSDAGQMATRVSAFLEML